jgi:hypothetical protein
MHVHDLPCVRCGQLVWTCTKTKREEHLNTSYWYREYHEATNSYWSKDLQRSHNTIKSRRGELLSITCYIATISRESAVTRYGQKFLKSYDLWPGIPMHTEAVLRELKTIQQNVLCFLLGNSPESGVYMPTFRNTLFHLHRQVGVKND